jgi:hypothetical protein
MSTDDQRHDRHVGGDAGRARAVAETPTDDAGDAGAVRAVAAVVDVGAVGREVPAVAVTGLAVAVGVHRAAGLVRVGPQGAGELGVVGVVAGVDDGHDPARAGAAVPALRGVDVGVGHGVLAVGVAAGVVQVPAVVRPVGVGDGAEHRHGGGEVGVGDARERLEVLRRQALGGHDGPAVAQPLGVDHAVGGLEGGEQLVGGGAGGGGEDVAGEPVALAEAGGDGDGGQPPGREHGRAGIAGHDGRGHEDRQTPLALHPCRPPGRARRRVR